MNIKWTIKENAAKKVFPADLPSVNRREPATLPACTAEVFRRCDPPCPAEVTRRDVLPRCPSVSRLRAKPCPGVMRHIFLDFYKEDLPRYAND